MTKTDPDLYRVTDILTNNINGSCATEEIDPKGSESLRVIINFAPEKKLRDGIERCSLS